MDKKYYTQKYRKSRRSTNTEKSAFLMRLNISLGIAIVAIGIYKLNNDFSQNFSMTYKELVSGDISFSDIKKDINEISSIGNGVAAFSSEDSSIKLDQSVIDYINNLDDSYVDNNTPATAP